MRALSPALGTCLLMGGLVGRYALTLRLMLAIVRRKLDLGLGNTTHTHTHATQLPATTQPVPTDGSTILEGGPNPSDPAAQAATLDNFGSIWPAKAGVWSPSLATRGGETHFIFIYFFPFLLSFWGIWALTKGTGSDRPTNGNDGVFLNGPLWAGGMPPMPEAR